MSDNNAPSHITFHVSKRADQFLVLARGQEAYGEFCTLCCPAPFKEAVELCIGFIRNPNHNFHKIRLDFSLSAVMHPRLQPNMEFVLKDDAWTYSRNTETTELLSVKEQEQFSTAFASGIGANYIDPFALWPSNSD
jgi:hypothetical protein